MPRIILKDKSPEYADTKKRESVRACDMPGCPYEGDHKAPKHRGLNEYYHFCTEHVRDYNKAWDFFSGMSEDEVQKHMERSLYGDRPTWRYNVDRDTEDELYRAAQDSYYYGDESAKHDANNNRRSSYGQDDRHHAFQGNTNKPEYEAMAIMGLEPPITMEGIKAQYKKLAKKYHPDLNKNDPKAEETLKKINMSYTILKLAFEEYKKLPDHKF